MCLYDNIKTITNRNLDCYETKDYKDVDRNTHKGGIEYLWRQNDDKGKLVYNLKGEYEKVHLIFFSPLQNAQDDYDITCDLVIYGDGEVLDNISLNTKDSPVDKEIVVSDVEELEFEFSGYTNNDSSGGTFVLTDMYAYNE